jgi:drug/metabolite transporter (DMT)-like permease
MGTGIVLCFLGALSFGLCACVSKIADRQSCKASGLIASLFGWAAIFMLIRTLLLGTGFGLPAKATGLAIVLGVSAAVAIFSFQVSISLGKVTVAWLVMNLSSGVPALVSIWIYREALTPLKCLAFVVALAALVCLFQGKRLEVQAAKTPI